MTPKNKLSFLMTLVMATAFLSTVGCDSEEGGSHDLVVRWNISGLNVCQAYLPPGQYAQDNLTFDQIVINVYEDDSAEVAYQEPISMPCSNFQHRLTRLPRGSYYITVDAYALYSGESIAFFQGAADVSVPAEGAIVDIPLSVASGQIDVNWKFAGGTICGVAKAGEVKDIIVMLNGMQINASCGDGQLTIENVYPDSGYRINAIALDSDGNQLYTATYDLNPFEVLPGDPYSATIEFK